MTDSTIETLDELFELSNKRREDLNPGVRELIENPDKDPISWPMNRDVDHIPAVVGYMCMIAWECEIGADSGGTKIYPSIEALKKDHEMADECGIVMVNVEFIKTIAPCTADFS